MLLPLVWISLNVDRHELERFGISLAQENDLANTCKVSILTLQHFNSCGRFQAQILHGSRVWGVTQYYGGQSA